MGTDLLTVITSEYNKRDSPKKGELGSKASNRSISLLYDRLSYRITCIRRSRKLYCATIDFWQKNGLFSGHINGRLS